MKNVTYINAGAGSGKTYTLTRILSEKLSEQINGASVIKPSQVILTTFTELAAAEFREKARQQILEAGNLDAAAQMDSAAIGTVHSVALRFIQKFWYLLDYGADIQIISERDEDFYMSQ
ncbi:MAG: UvrD-helicase domain-containing protein, partial [Bacteroidaceae bacterium]